MFLCSLSYQQLPWCPQLEVYRKCNRIPYDLHLLWSHKLWPEFAEMVVHQSWANLAAQCIIKLRDDPHADKAAEQKLKEDLLVLLLTLVGDIRSVKINNVWSPTSAFAISQVYLHAFTLCQGSPFLRWRSFTLTRRAQAWSLVNNRIKSKRDVASRKRQKLVHSSRSISPQPVNSDYDEADPRHSILKKARSQVSQ